MFEMSINHILFILSQIFLWFSTATYPSSIIVHLLSTNLYKTTGTEPPGTPLVVSRTWVDKYETDSPILDCNQMKINKILRLITTNAMLTGLGTVKGSANLKHDSQFKQMRRGNISSK